MNVQILDAAREDLAEGPHFYERQSPGLGDYFWDSLFADIDSLQLYAGIHEKAYEYHRLLASRFPFAVYYEVVEELARVVALLDCRRDPDWTERRLTREP